jgi:hypothetical protein
MNSLSIILGLVGIIISVLVGSYYFQKSKKEKKLTPILQFSGKLFGDIDPDIKKDLIFFYKKGKIENLSQAQFIIANTGEQSIRDIIEPLTLHLPSNIFLYNVELIEICPEGRKIDFKVNKSENSSEIIFTIPLLNTREFFSFRILYHDLNKKSDWNFNFSISAEELPPILESIEINYSDYEEEKGNKLIGSKISFLSIFGLSGFLILFILLSFKEPVSGKYIFNFNDFFNVETFDFSNVVIIIMSIIGFIFLLITFLGIVFPLALEIILAFKGRKTKFKIPSKYKNKYSA